MTAPSEPTVFEAGDFVRVISDPVRIKRLQRGHGEWAEQMFQSLGKIGRIEEVYSDGDLKIAICGGQWTYNPIALQFVFNFKSSLPSNWDERLREITTSYPDFELPEESLWRGILTPFL